MLPRYAHYKSLQISWAAPAVLRVAFNRPDRRNALDELAHTEICGIWRDLDADKEVSSVLVCGEGSDFCVGGELELVEQMLEDREQRRRTMSEAQALVYNIINCSKPVVSAMQGSVVGGGLAVGLLADISIAAKDARLLDGHVRIGLAAGDHAVLLWPQLCGLAKAKYHLLMNESLSGVEAERIGLVSLAVDAAELENVALDVAQKLAKMPASATRWTKYALNNWLRTAGPIFDASVGLEALSFDTGDVAEAVKAIRERQARRKP